MINVWKYLPGTEIKLINNDNKTFIGRVISVEDQEENDENEDRIAIELQSGEIYSFLTSEIKSIEINQ